MYRSGYAEIVADDQAEARRNELMALDVVIDRLEAARETPGDVGRLHGALDAMEALWAIFMVDAAHPENALPKETRQNIISIGRWIFARSADLREVKAASIDALIEINAAIRSGLEGRS